MFLFAPGSTVAQLNVYSLVLTVCVLKSLFYISSQFVNSFSCFPVMIHNIRKEASMRAKLILWFYNSRI